MRYLGIDYGKKRVGIALSDEEGTLAFPKTILKNEKSLTREILDIVQKENVMEIVLGASFDEFGNPNEIMADIEKFKTLLEKESGLPVHFQKEAMTSVHARNFRDEMRDDGRRRPQKNEAIDASAAALILQRFLDREKIKNSI